MNKHSDDAAIREQAYYFWEQDGRPHGRDNEYWQRAMVAVSEKSQMDSLVKPAPRKAAKPVAKAETKPGKAPVKLKAAASTAKSAPAKSAKSGGKPSAKTKAKKK